MEKAEINEGDKIRLIEKAESECSHVSRDAQAWPWTFCSSVWRSNASFAHRTFRQVCVEGAFLCLVPKHPRGVDEQCRYKDTGAVVHNPAPLCRASIHGSQRQGLRTGHRHARHGGS